MERQTARDISLDADRGATCSVVLKEMLALGGVEVYEQCCTELRAGYQR
jgi:hypothetical protein